MISIEILSDLDKEKIENLFSNLNDVGLRTESANIELVLGYLASMNRTINDLTAELAQVKEELKSIKDNQIKEKYNPLFKKIENSIQSAKEILSEAKSNLMSKANDLINVLKEHGQTAFVNAAEALKLTDVIASINSGLSNIRTAIGSTADKIDELRVQLHTSTESLKNAGKIIIGKNPTEVKELEVEKGTLAKIRNLCNKTDKALFNLETKGEILIDKLNKTASEVHCRNNYKPCHIKL